jgi:hypothetical protein
LSALNLLACLIGGCIGLALGLRLASYLPPPPGWLMRFCFPDLYRDEGREP